MHCAGLDILVNNAGVLETGTIETTSLEQYDRVMNVNIRSVFALTRLCAPHLIAAQGNIGAFLSKGHVKKFQLSERDFDFFSSQ